MVAHLIIFFTSYVINASASLMLPLHHPNGTTTYTKPEIRLANLRFTPTTGNGTIWDLSSSDLDIVDSLRAAMKWGIPTQGLEMVPIWRIGNETEGKSCARATPSFDPLKLTHEYYPKFIFIPMNAGTMVEVIGTHLFEKFGLDHFWWGRSTSELHILKKAGVHVERIPPELNGQSKVPRHPYYSCSWWHRPVDWWRAEGYDYNDGRRTFCIVRSPFARLNTEVNYLRLLRKRDNTCLKSKEAEKVIKATLSELKKKAVSFGGKEYNYPQNDCHWVTQANYVFDDRGCRVCDDVVYFEDLFRQLMILFTAYGFDPAFKFMKVNFNICQLTKMEHETVQFIAEAYEKDFLAFRYSTHP